MADAEQPDESIVKRCHRIFEDTHSLWRDYHEAMDEEEAFLSGDRYEDDNGQYNRDRRLVQIRGNEIQDTTRHIAAKSTERPRNVEANPVDRIDDPDMAETAAALIEWETGNQWKDFDGLLEEAIIAAREQRFGAVMMDWDPDCGPYGEILYRYVDGRRLRWDASYPLHHPRCEWMMEERRVPVAQAREDYDAPWLKPDRETYDGEGKIRSDSRIQKGIAYDRMSTRAQMSNDDCVTLWFWWFKNDRTVKDKQEETGYVELPPGDRYLSCTDCSYRSDSQTDLQKSGRITGELPESFDGCPDCGGELKRIDATQETADVLHYTKGRRLVIVAPFCPNPKDADKPVVDDKWPIPTARSFPILAITAYVKPGRPMGPSDVTLMWDQQVAADNLRTMAIQRIFEHRTYWKIPRVGLYDGAGRRFQFREDQFNVMYADGSNQFGPMDVQRYEGTGLDPQFGQVYQLAQQALVQYRGIADLGLTQESSKDIAASTVSQIAQMGEVPTAHFNRRKNRALGQFYGILWDYICATYTPARMARLRIAGVDILARLHGDDLPNYDFRVDDTPAWAGLDKARSDAFDRLVEVAQNTPQYLEVFAEMHNLPRSVLRRIQEINAEQPPLPPPGDGAGPVPPGSPPPDAGSALPGTPPAPSASDVQQENFV